MTGDSAENIEFTFPLLNDQRGNLTLRTVVSQYTGAAQSTRASATELFQVLGRLRCLLYDLQQYNNGLSNATDAFAQYWRQHTLSVLSGFGFSLRAEQGLLQIDGLADLILQLEAIYETDLKQAKDLIDKGKIKFSGLCELFTPGRYVKAPAISEANVSGIYRVTDVCFEEKRGIFGSQKQFRITLEVVVPLGDHFSVTSFSGVITSWSGPQVRNLSELAYQPVLIAEEQYFLTRAHKAVTYGSMGAKYVAYSPNAFFAHHGRNKGSRYGMARANNTSRSLGGGRIMVDIARGASLGHYPCQSANEVTLAIIQLLGRYRQWLLTQSQAEAVNDESLILWDKVPEHLLMCCWPALVGFSFTAKTWGHVLVDSLLDIKFQDHAFNQLVLSEERKLLIRAVARCGVTQDSHDLISSKQGGLIFLLHGPPGVGKTLTAEAVAEVLHRPLYYITMGELGVTPDELESRLSDVLELCAGWNALAVLDEADVFLETRSNSDLIRNAMVCVMLRILEYHPGILFLTTNRVQTLDPAFESRITLAIRYKTLDHKARVQIWKSQLIHIGSIPSGTDYDVLAKYELNGRQIKNLVRLAETIAKDGGTAISQKLILSTIEIASIGLGDIRDDNTWEKATS
ncbi:ATP-dependent zinc metalloprotease FtsH [Paramyrothecium foliicola]|nr:ATP-dependent zinc metalloprotease FtsH [Paramyrothecium foliicola]